MNDRAFRDYRSLIVGDQRVACGASPVWGVRLTAPASRQASHRMPAHHRVDKAAQHDGWPLSHCCDRSYERARQGRWGLLPGETPALDGAEPDDGLAVGHAALA